MSWLDEIRFDSRGLVPVIAQDASSGEVLMFAFASREALDATERTGHAHYWSRSRQSLWRKGATSGHVQEVVEMRVDCDGDAVLYRVRAHGPACHTLERSCFHRRGGGDTLARAAAGGHILARVDEVIAARQADPEEKSYTSYLFEQGVDKILKKLGEETTEVVIAAKNEAPDPLASESADLIFHLLVLLRARDLPLQSVWNELEERFGRTPRPRRDPAEKDAEP